MAVPTCECVKELAIPEKLDAIFCALAEGTGGGLPDQAGHAGEFLTTDGTDASWTALPGGGNVSAGAALTLNSLMIGQGAAAVAVTSTAAGALTFLGTPSSANLRSLVTDESGSGALLFANGAIGTPASGTLTNCTGLTIAGITGLGTLVGATLATNVGVLDGMVVVGGVLGTPSSGNVSNCTGYTVGNLSGLGANVATFLATPSSANLLAAVTDETGSGALVFGTSPTITTSLVAGGTTIALFNTVATTVNAFGVATTLNIGAAAATVCNFGGHTSAAELRFLEPSGSGTNYSGFKQPALAASITYLLPSDAPTNGQVLACQADGTMSWETAAGTGDVSGPVSSTDRAVATWNGTGGDTLRDTGVIIDASDNVSGIVTLTTTNTTVSGTFLPSANDAVALGASGTAWSDLFLASGAVINFNAGNLTLTHSAGILTSNGAYVGTTGTFGSTTSLLLGTAGSAVGNVGFRNATSGTITVAPVTGALGTVTLTLPAVTATVCAAATSTTTTQALFATSTAGAPAYRAVTAADITAGILAGNMTLGESTGQIVLDPALSGTGTWSGIMEAGTAGATLAFGDCVYLAVADSRWELADASASSTSGAVKIGICVLAAAADGDPTNILLFGKINAATVFPTFTVGAPVYISESAGDLTNTAPTTTDSVTRIVGYGNTGDEIMWCPDNFFITHT